MVAQLRRELLCRFDSTRRTELQKLPLNELLRTARPFYKDPRGPTAEIDPFEVLARLPFRTYVNATGDDLLVQALGEVEIETTIAGVAGKVRRAPQERLFDWQGNAEDAEVEPITVEKPPPGKPFAKAAGVGRPPVDRRWCTTSSATLTTRIRLR